MPLTLRKRRRVVSGRKFERRRMTPKEAAAHVLAGPGEAYLPVDFFVDVKPTLKFKGRFRRKKQ